jgi:hypothetical protein
MIFYTVTTQKTQGQFGSTSSSFMRRNVEFGVSQTQGSETPIATSTYTEFEDLSDYGSHTYSITAVSFTSSDGGVSNSETVFESRTLLETVEYPVSAHIKSSFKYTRDSNNSETLEGSRHYEEDFSYGDTTSESTSYSEIRTLSPISTKFKTTTVTNKNAFVTETTASEIATAIGTTTLNILTEGTLTKYGTQTLATTSIVSTAYTSTGNKQREVQSTVTTEIETQTEVLTIDNNSVPASNSNYDSNKTTFSSPPRDTATVLCAFENEIAWVITATDLSLAGPWSLSEIANSHTSQFTVAPLYVSKPLAVVNETDATFAYQFEEPKTVTVTLTVLVNDGNKTRTFWRPKNGNEFPLVSLTSPSPKYKTSTIEIEFDTFESDNSILTASATEIGTRTNFTAEKENFGSTYQELFENSYAVTRQLNQLEFSATNSTSYAGYSFETFKEDGTTKTIFYTNVSIESGSGQTIEGTVFESVGIRAFSPCAVFHNETTLISNWGVYGENGVEANSKIEAQGLSVKFPSFANLLPGVSVPFPSSFSYITASSTISALVAGNMVSLTTFLETTSNSSEYEFNGQNQPHTEQDPERIFFVKSNGLRSLSFYGPNPATASIETRLLPGEYVRVIHGTDGDFSLITFNQASTASGTLSKNLLVFPAEKSFYTTTVGAPFLTFSRNPIP